MGFFDSLFGKSQRRDLQSGKQASDQAMQQGYDQAANIGQQYYRDAQNYLNPYINAQPSRATGMYENALGMNGRGAQQQFMTEYAGDPFRQSNMDAASAALRRTYNARGMDTSGNALLAAARASQERGSQDYNAYLNRLQGASEADTGRRAQFAMAGSNAAGQFGNSLMGMRYGYGQQQAGNEASYANAMAGSRSAPWQNLIGLGGVLAQGYAGWNKK